LFSLTNQYKRSPRLIINKRERKNFSSSCFQRLRLFSVKFYDEKRRLNGVSRRRTN
jgi:hypothetical protein